jgi:hypothetical protein
MALHGSFADVQKGCDRGGCQVIPVREHDDRSLSDAEREDGREYFGAKFWALEELRSRRKCLS